MCRSKPQKDKWTPEDKLTAHKQGWDIFQVDSGRAQIQKLDDPYGVSEDDGQGPYVGPVFTSDREAIFRVEQAAFEGDEFARHALRHIKQHNDRLYRQRRRHFTSRFSRAIKLMELPPVQYEKYVQQLSEYERERLKTELTNLITSAARSLGYVREASRGHQKAVKGFNRLLTQVRRAMGFTCPHAANVNF